MFNLHTALYYRNYLESIDVEPMLRWACDRLQLRRQYVVRDSNGEGVYLKFVNLLTCS